MTRGALRAGRGAPPRPGLNLSQEKRSRRSRNGLVLGLAAAALLLAGLGAVGPADHERATYSWPPPHLPDATPERLWYSPLLLTRQVPAKIHATIPCMASPPLVGAGRSVTVLATARTPVRRGGLSILREGSRLRFMIGGYRFASVLPPTEPRGSDCSVLLDVEGSTWSLREPGNAARRGDLGNAPFVSGLFSELDIRSGPRPAIEVTTEPYGARTTAWQTFAWVTATALALAVLLLASQVIIGRSTRRRVTGVLSSLPRSLRPVDGFVALVLLTWWVIGPVVFDDGWAKARQTNYDVSGGFSNYYTTYGSDLPLSFWLEWIEHWVIGKFDAVLIMRLPALVLLGSAWVICRWVLSRLLDGARRAAGAEWVLGIAFCLNACAWGVTLRPEPAVALLLVGVLACALRFLERPGPAPLALGAILVALGLNAHPAGLVTLAPLLVSAPRIVRWARDSGWAALAVITTSGLALLLVLATVGADLAVRAQQAGFARQGDAIASWRDELSRYQFAGAEATTLRRESVALMFVTVLAYLLRRRRRHARLDLASASLGVSLLLLIPTPSKWAWHFGALVGLFAVAVAAEVARLSMRKTGADWPVRPVLAAGAIALVIGFSWGSPRSDWSSGFDLRTIDWTLQTVENRLSLAKLMPVLLLVVLGAAVLIVLARRGRSAALRVPWSFVPWLVPLAVLPLLAYNVGTLIRDAVKTPAWTLARQNVESFAGRAGCGLADDTLVARPRSMRPLRPVAGRRPGVRAAWTPAPPVVGLQTFSLSSGGGRRIETSWYSVPRGGPLTGFFVTNAPEAAEALEVRWGRRAGDGIRTGVWQQISLPSADQALANTLPWLLVAQKQLPERPFGADLIQFSAAQSDTTPPRALSLTGAVSYDGATLTSLIAADGARSLVLPNLLLYVPCTRLPKLARGVVQVPTIVFANHGLWPLEFATSPFHGLRDVYRVRDLSGADSAVPLENGTLVLWVDPHVPGGALAFAERKAPA